MSVFGLPGRRNQMEQFRIGALGVEAGIAITPKSRVRFFRTRLFSILHPQKVSPADKQTKPATSISFDSSEEWLRAGAVLRSMAGLSDEELIKVIIDPEKII